MMNLEHMNACFSSSVTQSVTSVCLRAWCCRLAPGRDKSAHSARLPPSGRKHEQSADLLHAASSTHAHPPRQASTFSHVVPHCHELEAGVEVASVIIHRAPIGVLLRRSHPKRTASTRPRMHGSDKCPYLRQDLLLQQIIQTADDSNQDITDQNDAPPSPPPHSHPPRPHPRHNDEVRVPVVGCQCHFSSK